MGPIEYIRRNVLGLTQGAFASVAGTSQATVSRWESGELEPSRSEMERIRQEAISRGIDWRDDWFFTAPRPSPSPSEVSPS